MALRILRIPPAAKSLVQVKTAIPIHVTAIARLQVGKPATRDIDERGDASTQNTGSHQDDPDLARIRQLLQMPQYAGCAGVQVLQPLPFFRILKDPVDGGEVVVADPPPRAFDVPVQPIGVLGVLQVIACATGSVQVV